MSELITREPIKVIADILKKELNLDELQIVLAYEKFNLTNTYDLFISLSCISGKAIGNNVCYEYENSTLQEVQQILMNEIIQIDIMGGNEARQRKEEVMMALRSTYSQQMQELHSMQIARIPREFTNASMLEETAYLNRYILSVVVNAIYVKKQEIEYYENFKDAEVTANE